MYVQKQSCSPRDSLQCFRNNVHTAHMDEFASQRNIWYSSTWRDKFRFSIAFRNLMYCSAPTIKSAWVANAIQQRRSTWRSWLEGWLARG